MKPLRTLAIVAVIVTAAAAASADDLTGSTHFICSAAQMNRCATDGECTSGAPWKHNIPQFIQVDLKEKTLSTTPASGQNRVTPIKNLERADGLIILQGAENGRAFSFLIVEQTGIATISVALDDAGVVVFGACTPN